MSCCSKHALTTLLSAVNIYGDHPLADEDRSVASEANLIVTYRPRNGCTCSFTIDGATEDLTSSKHPRRCRQVITTTLTFLCRTDLA